MMKSIAENMLRMMWMKRMKKRVICKCLSNGESKNL
jgi:hypothetical protein